MANSSSRRARPVSIPAKTTTSGTKKSAKKKATKPAPRKKRTLLIPDLAEASIVSIDRAKGEFGVGHTTRAAARMIEDYWRKSDDLIEAKRLIRELEEKLEALAVADQQIKNAKTVVEEILEEFNHRF